MMIPKHSGLNEALFEIFHTLMIKGKCRNELRRKSNKFANLHLFNKLRLLFMHQIFLHIFFFVFSLNNHILFKLHKNYYNAHPPQRQSQLMQNI